jgi:hyperpolarization activated cyclic nucleotide-gated potassium channel 2
MSSVRHHGDGKLHEDGPIDKYSVPKKTVIKIPKSLFKPDSFGRLSWDIYMMVLIMYYAFAVPIRIAFDITPSQMWLEYFFTGCFALDICINFNTAVIGQGGMLITSRANIARDYFKMWFWIDFVATFPFEVVTGGGAGGDASAAKLGRLGKIFRLLRIFKLLRLLKLGRILRRLKHSTHMNPNYMLLGRTLAVMVMMLHWTACGYWGVVQLEETIEDPFGRETECFDAEGLPVTDPYGNVDLEHPDCIDVAVHSSLEAWRPPFFIMRAEFSEQYAFAFFWSVSVVTGAGWDIIPATPPEVAYSSVMIIVGTIFYITILGSVTSIVSNINVDRSKKMSQLDAVLTHLHQTKAPRALVHKIRGYYDFRWADDGSSAEGIFGTEVESLPKSLQLELFQEMHSAYLHKVPALKPLPPMATFFLSKKWSRVIYLPDDEIVQEGSPILALYFVLRGRVGMSIKLHVGMRALRLVDLTEGGFFGEDSCRRGKLNPRHMSTASALTHCELLMIPKEAYLEVANEYKEILKELDPLLELEQRRRLVKLRWKKACAKVVIANRWNFQKNKLKPPPQLQAGGSTLSTIRRIGTKSALKLTAGAVGVNKKAVRSNSELFGDLLRPTPPSSPAAISPKYD